MLHQRRQSQPSITDLMLESITCQFTPIDPFVDDKSHHEPLLDDIINSWYQPTNNPNLTYEEFCSSHGVYEFDDVHWLNMVLYSEYLGEGKGLSNMIEAYCRKERKHGRKPYIRDIVRLGRCHYKIIL